MKYIRENRTLSQAQLAEKSGVSIRMIRFYEQGANDINKAQCITLYKMAKVLQCNVEDLMEL